MLSDIRVVIMIVIPVVACGPGSVLFLGGAGSEGQDWLRVRVHGVRVLIHVLLRLVSHFDEQRFVPAGIRGIELLKRRDGCLGGNVSFYAVVAKETRMWTDGCWLL